MQYITLKEIYLTFLTNNDTYMEAVPVGSILTLDEKGDLWYNGKCSIDYVTMLLRYECIQDYISN